MFSAQMFVMDFMCAANGFKIRPVSRPEPFDALVNKHIVHQEIREPIQGNAKPYPKEQAVFLYHTDPQSEHTWYGKDEKEIVILFEKSIGLFLVMIAMPSPEESMHDEFVRGPGNPFHGQESEERGDYGNNDLHDVTAG